MKITRLTGLVALLAAGALTISACGSDDNSAASSSSSSSSSSSAATTAAATSAAATAAASSAAPMSSAPMTSGAMTSSAMSSGAMTSGAATSGSASSSAAGGSATTFDGAGFTCATGSLRSSGSTAQGKVIAQWINDYNAKCKSSINPYGGGGSGKGVTDFIGNQTDFGGSDSPLKEAQFSDAKSKRCDNNDAIDLPMVTGPIALSYNLSGVDKLVLTPKVLVGIFGGTIKTWDDAAIKASEPQRQRCRPTPIADNPPLARTRAPPTTSPST